MSHLLRAAFHDRRTQDLALYLVGMGVIFLIFLQIGLHK
jgi:hypothetical protein